MYFSIPNYTFKLSLSCPSYSSLGLTCSSARPLPHRLSPPPPCGPAPSLQSTLHSTALSLCRKTRQRPKRLRDRPRPPDLEAPFHPAAANTTVSPMVPGAAVLLLISVTGCKLYHHNPYDYDLFRDSADWGFDAIILKCYFRNPFFL